MTSYTVHAPPTEAGLPDAGPERFAFVKDGFSWPALFLPVLWIVWRRLWLTLMAYVIAMLLLAWTERLASDEIAMVIAVLAAILFALEANNIRRLSLERRGWRELGTASGDSLEEAEIRFFESWRSGRGDLRPLSASARGDEAESRADYDGPIFGLFPEPER